MSIWNRVQYPTQRETLKRVGTTYIAIAAVAILATTISFGLQHIILMYNDSPQT